MFLVTTSIKVTTSNPEAFLSIRNRSAAIGPTAGFSSIEEDSLVDVDLEDADDDDDDDKTQKKRNKKKKGDGDEDGEDDEKDCESQSQMSDSVIEDDPSEVDLIEKQLRNSLIGFVIAFCGFFLIYKLLRRLFGGYKSTEVYTEAAGEVVETATDAAVAQAAFASNQAVV